MSFDDLLEGRLSELRVRGALRQPTSVRPDAIIFCSNDYLGYATELLSTLDVGEIESGAGASRLISGDHRTHREAEDALADWVGTESALLMSSGYATNVGVISALAGEGDVIVSDALNHASIIDGCRLSRARVLVTDHLDTGAVEQALRSAPDARRRWIVTESYFSMDGDGPDLAALRALADAHGAFLIVDEAHALGVFGEQGEGRCREAGVRADVLIGTLGKALGLAGAFVCGSSALRDVLWNDARSFVFSTAIPPWLAAATSRRVVRVRGDHATRQRLWSLVEALRGRLRDAGVIVRPSFGPIVPLVVGTPAAALRVRDALLEEGVFVQAIRPPTVPEGSSRLRITLHAKLSDDDLEKAATALTRCVRAASDRSRGEPATTTPPRRDPTS